MRHPTRLGCCRSRLCQLQALAGLALGVWSNPLTCCCSYKDGVQKRLFVMDSFQVWSGPPAQLLHACWRDQQCTLCQLALRYGCRLKATHLGGAAQALGLAWAGQWLLTGLMSLQDGAAKLREYCRSITPPEIYAEHIARRSSNGRH